MPSKKLKIAVIDFETDPFKFGRIPKPFCVEFLAEDRTNIVFWGTDCAHRLVDWIEQLPDAYMIFAHNGGKFDFWFIHSYVSNPIKVIASRIVSSRLFQHTLRDSFAIIPVALAAYNKIKINYAKFERHRREQHKPEILRYLHQDCVDLLTLVTAFVGRFGSKLTVASTAMTELKKFHSFTKCDASEDEYFRQFYFGGRVEAFQSGILKGPWQVVDLNSSYPKSMRDYNHPVNGAWDISEKIPRSYKRPFFCKFIGTNRGAIPIRGEEGDLDFQTESGEFFACSHELEIALDLGLVKIDKVIEVYRAQEFIRFDDYVNHFYDEKVRCKKAGDRIGELFAKFMLNSAYGKFGQNPDKYKDWCIVHDIDEESEAIENGYVLTSEFSDFDLYSRPAEIRDGSFYDVSIAASITSASRAQLLAGLQLSNDPIYCDTDSIICRSFSGEISDTVLGAWKNEKGAQFAAIAGKKLYALYNTPNDVFNEKDAPAKVVSKGGTLTLKQLITVAKGGTFKFQNPAPTFSLRRSKEQKGNARFITREFRQTIDGDE